MGLPRVRLEVQELLEIPAQMVRPDSEHERNCVHQVALARPVRTDNRGKIVEWPDGVLALV